jgi:hypothetical protein
LATRYVANRYDRRVTPLPISIVIMLAGAATMALAPPIGGSRDGGQPPEIERGRYHLYAPMTASDAATGPQQTAEPEGDPLTIAEAEYMVQALDVLLDASPHAEALERLLAEAKLDDPAWVAKVRVEVDAITAETSRIDGLASPGPRFDEAHGLLAEASALFTESARAFESAGVDGDPLARLRGAGLAVQALDALGAAHAALPEVTPRIVP